MGLFMRMGETTGEYAKPYNEGLRNLYTLHQKEVMEQKNRRGHVTRMGALTMQAKCEDLVKMDIKMWTRIIRQRTQGSGRLL